MELFVSLLIPTNTNLVNRYDSNVKYSGKYKLDIQNYGHSFHIPFYINGSYSLIPLKSLLEKFYTFKNRPGIELVQIENKNVSNFILDKRKSNINNLVNDYYTAISFNVTDLNKFYTTLHYSTLAFHSSANILHEMSNLLLAFYTKDLSKSISTINAPLTANNSLYYGIDILEYLACMDILPSCLFNLANSLILTFMISSTVLFISKERLNGSKSLQFLSGTNCFTYWLSNILFDLSVFLFNNITLIVCIKIIYLIQNDPFNELNSIGSNQNLTIVFLLFVMSSLPSCCFAYICSFLFKSDLISFLVLFILLAVVCFLDMIFSFIQLLVYLDIRDQNKTIYDLMSFFRYLFLILFPNVTLKRGLYYLKIKDNSYCIKSLNRILHTNYSYNSSPMDFNEPGIGFLILIFSLQFLAFIFLLFVFEFKTRIYFLYSNLKQHSTSFHTNIQGSLIVNKLSKKFKKNGKQFLAVNNLSFSISNSECFG